MVSVYWHVHVRLCKLTYSVGAPECYRSDEFLEQIRVNVKPLVDVWSFGGVCSEAAVWVVLGMSGLVEYRYQRQQEIVGKKTIQDGPCFHDGEKLLEAVEAVHDRLHKRGEVRPGDHITKPVLVHMVTSMLDEDPDTRHNAAWLWRYSRKLVKEAQSKLEAPDQPQTPTKKDATISKAQHFGQNPPDTPPRTSYNASQPYNGDPHAYGPPPNYPQYNSNFQTPGRPLSGRDFPKRRSDTWHEYNTRTEMIPGSSNGILSPPVAIRQAPGTSPPPDSRPTFQEPIEISAMGPNETATRPGGTQWHNTDGLSYSPLNAPREFDPLEYPNFPHLTIHESSSSDADPAANVYLARHTQSEAELDIMPMRLSGAYRPLVEPHREHLESASKPVDSEKSHLMADMALKDTSKKSPPDNSQSLRMVEAAPPKPPASKTKPEKPYLSYKEAKKIRERRSSLPYNQQALLNDLKGRDHVSSSSAALAPSLMQYS